MEKKKRRKLFHFNDLLKNKIEFYDCFRVSNGYQKGTRYNLSNKLTDQQKELLKKYDNVIFSQAIYKYAQEIKHDSIILLD